MDADAARPPEWMQAEDPSLADGARKHVKNVERAWKKGWSPKGKRGKGREVRPHPSVELCSVLVFDNERQAQGDHLEQKDLYKWAVVHENQRGLTIFSTPYYSAKSLLVFDPPPFTAPGKGQDSSEIRTFSVDTYPLPDPTWRWVSEAWLVDMRRGVGHDGFEYNWYFRCNNWRGQTGWFSLGGFVRRRTWMRLMMHPSKARRQIEAMEEERALEDAIDKRERPVSALAIGRVWRGDNGDWERVHKTLKRLGHDGPRFDLWADWLSDMLANKTTPSPRQLTEDEDRSEVPLAVNGAWLERPKREWVRSLLQQYGRELGGCFVYPNSRVRLWSLFLDAGLIM